MTLFEDGNWRLVDGVWKTISIMHMCNVTTLPTERANSDGWWFYVQNGTCNSCHAKAPDKLVGLQALVNWER